MSDKYTTVFENLVVGVEIVVGGVVTFLSFMLKSTYNKFLKLQDEVAELKSEQREDNLKLVQVEKDWKSEVKRIEGDMSSKIDRLEELTELRLKAIDVNTDKLTEAVKDLNEVVKGIMINHTNGRL